MSKVIGSCKKCGSKNVRPVSYGMDVPAEWINDFPVNAAGEVMGGCLVDLGSARLICLDCGEALA